jgi:hypothetical protein
MIYTSDLYKSDLKRPMDEELYVRIELYNSNMEYLKEITKQVTFDGIGSISANRNDPVRRSFSFSLDNQTGEYTWGTESLIWIDKRVKIFTGRKLSNGFIEYLPQGVFVLTQPQDSHQQDGKYVTVECHDLTYLMTEGNSPFINEQIIEAGAKCDKTIKTIAEGAGINNFLFDTITETIPYELTYSMTSDRWQAITEIANFAKCEAFFDTNGYLRLKKVADINDLMNEPAVWKFYVGDGFYSGNIRKMDSGKTANHIRVLGGSSQTETIIYDLVVDETAGSIWADNPYSIQKIGRKLYFHNNGNPDSLITKLDDAKFRAKYELLNRLSYVEQLSMNTAPIYFLEPSDIIEVIDEANGINSRYRIESLQIPLRPETMTLELSKEERFLEDWDEI